MGLWSEKKEKFIETVESIGDGVNAGIGMLPISAEKVHAYIRQIPVRNKLVADEVGRQRLSAPKTREVMEDIGFENVKEVVEARELKKEQNAASEFVEIYQYLLDLFPWGIYLTNEDVEAITEKYDLFHGDSDLYIGEMPKKNMIQMKNRHNAIFAQFKRVIEKYEGREMAREHIAKYIEYSVIAPREKFSTEEDEVETEGRRLKKRVAVQDPIVLLKVKRELGGRDEEGELIFEKLNGYVVVSMWGPEADLPEVKR
jgi:hypothetical protein